MSRYLITLVDSLDPTPEGREQLKSRLQRKLGIDTAVVEDLFARLPVKLQKGVEKEKAESYREALEQLGAIVRIEPEKKLEAKEATDDFLDFESTDSSDDGQSLSFKPESSSGSAPPDVSNNQPLPDGHNLGPAEDHGGEKKDLLATEHRAGNEDPALWLDNPAEQPAEAGLASEQSMPIKEVSSSDQNSTNSSAEASGAMLSQPLEPVRESEEAPLPPATSLVKPIIFLVLLLSVVLVLLISFLPLGTSSTSIELKPDAFKQLLKQQRSIISGNSDETQEETSSEEKPELSFSGFTKIPGLDPDGSIAVEAQAVYKGKDLQSLQIALSQEPPPELTPEQIVDGFRHRPYLRKLTVEDLGPESFLNKEPGVIGIEEKVYVYLEDSEGTGRTAALMEIDMRKNKESVVLKWSLEHKQARPNSAKRLSENSFALSYQGQITLETEPNSAIPQE